MKSKPHRCEPCVAEASYFGQLVFGQARPPSCKVHGVPITPIEVPQKWIFKRSPQDRMDRESMNA